MFGRSYDRPSSLRSSPELVDHIEPIDSGLDELEETLDNLSETLTLSNLSPDPPGKYTLQLCFIKFVEYIILIYFTNPSIIMSYMQIRRLACKCLVLLYEDYCWSIWPLLLTLFICIQNSSLFDNSSSFLTCFNYHKKIISAWSVYIGMYIVHTNIHNKYFSI